MTSVNFLVTNRAVLKPRRAQIVKRWRHAAEHLPCTGSNIRSYVGVTLQAHKSNFMPGEHPRIRRSVRLVATAAAFQTHGRVLECEGPSLVGVTAQTAGLVCGKSSHLLRTKTSMRIVAVDARHCALRQSVSVRSLKLRPCTQVAAGALRVDLRRLVRPKRASGAMNGVAAAAGDLSFGMPALNAAGVGRLDSDGKSGRPDRSDRHEAWLDSECLRRKPIRRVCFLDHDRTRRPAPRGRTSLEVSTA